MNLYEIEIYSLWYIAAKDDFYAMEILKEELANREISDEEVDEALEDPLIREIDSEEASTIEVGYDGHTVWELFTQTYDSGLIYTDFEGLPLDEEDEEEDAF